MSAAQQLRQQDIQQGMQQGIYTVARNMLRKNVSVDPVACWVDLPKEELAKLAADKR